jgi:TolB-like protein/Tfp pilus assembly protein PilF
MNQDRVPRRLAAILAADVSGYSRLMEQDEAGTLDNLKAQRREIFDPLVARYGGRVVKLMGDGVLIEFASAVDAVQCALDLQSETALANDRLPHKARMVSRIGVNLGDVIIEDDDIYGDGVNIAARLQTVGAPGEICISANVHEQVKRKLEASFDDLGAMALKNISEPVRVYRVSAGSNKAKVAPSLPLPAKPSIAVLPFTDMSGERDQDMFVDGLTEDLITDLSRNQELFVIARHSTFAYKGRSVDVREIARNLGVRYVLEGSARRAAGRVRINVQLIDAIEGGHLWADRFDRSIEDVFALQDEVTGRIVKELAGRLTVQPARNRPKKILAYDLCLRARRLIEERAGSPAALEASFVAWQASVVDPGYAEAHRLLAFALYQGWALGIEPMEPSRTIACEVAERAVKLDPGDAGNRWVYGYLLAHERRWEECEAEFAAAFAIDPDHADALALYSEIVAFDGRPLEALEILKRALRLNPHPAPYYYWELGLLNYVAHQYEAAVEALTVPATYALGSRRMLAASLAQLGRLDEARREAELFTAENPRFTISHWAKIQPARDETVVQHFVDGYRLAGLAE